MELQINEDYKEESSHNIIKVVGIGGAGNNAVNDMYERKVDGIDYVVCNTDIQDLNHSHVPHKLQIGVRLTEGLGAGSIPQSGKDAAEESEEAIREMLGGTTKMVILTAGMGGGTGTGATPVVARIAQDMGLVVVSIVTTPFGFERQRLKEAVIGIEVLEEVSDALLIINNQKLQRMYGDLSFPEACGKANEVLVMAAKSISEIVTKTAEQNIDYADLERMLRGSGMAVFGVGSAKGGEDRVGEAIKAALYSPLLDNCDISGAKSLLVNIVLGEKRLSVQERRNVGVYMRRMAGSYHEMKHGTRIDENLASDELVITIIATNFSENELGITTRTEEAIPAHPIDVEHEEDNDWMKVEDAHKLEEKARRNRERKEKQRQARLKAKEEAERRAREKASIPKPEIEQEIEEVGAKRPDPIEKLKKKKTSTKRGGGMQQLIDFFGGTDVRDDVEM
ncbi:cell division protein FtsZ [Balneicella halophila]|uniref:Cell division protein FtsZ n=1 Tax=Balneicella halophila TaxID=1537566 RepID=A0A7L4UP91_BALHA|nr:cell division protein FtsZ [Balneicella halophila]PVX50945.1 cell division protein FtsZ [Balneicella halophila]